MSPMEYVGWVLFIAFALTCLVMLLEIPGHIARKRNAVNRKVIWFLGWVGLIFFPAWIAALIWACVDQPYDALKGYTGAKDMNYPD